MAGDVINMFETLAVIGVITPIFLIQIYNARAISKLNTKVDLIYKNLDIKVDFKK